MGLMVCPLLWHQPLRCLHRQRRRPRRLPRNHWGQEGERGGRATPPEGAGVKGRGMRRSRPSSTVGRRVCSSQYPTEKTDALLMLLVVVAPLLRLVRPLRRCFPHAPVVGRRIHGRKPNGRHCPLKKCGGRAGALPPCRPLPSPSSRPRRAPRPAPAGTF